MSHPSRTPRTTRLVVHYEVPAVCDDWVIPEGTVPESRLHDQAAGLIRALLDGWVERSGIHAQVDRNLALRFDERRPRLGIDPDVCVTAPPPPDGDELTSLRLWREGHEPPLLAVEVVSLTHPNKDYTTVPDRHAACGTQELWVFDPDMAGPRYLGGPHRIQLWVRSSDGEFARTYAGDGPVYSPAVNGWLFAVSEGRRLRIAFDREGTDWWMTKEERERAEKERERAEKERERAEKERERAEKEILLARIRELEAKQSGG